MARRGESRGRSRRGTGTMSAMKRRVVGEIRRRGPRAQSARADFQERERARLGFGAMDPEEGREMTRGSSRRVGGRRTSAGRGRSSRRGFAAMSPGRRKEAARKGGRTSRSGGRRR